MQKIFIWISLSSSEHSLYILETEKDDTVENLESTDEESDSEDKETSQNEEFSEGQVYYSSLGKQVHVYPENVSGDVEVTVI